MADDRKRMQRRTLLKGGVALAALSGASAFLAACSSPTPTQPQSSAPTGAPSASPAPVPTATGSLAIGSGYGDEPSKGALQALADAFTASTRIAVTVNSLQSDTFEEVINAYLQGTPDEVFTWFAGYRMRFFAGQGLAADISDVWSHVGSRYSDAFRAASTGVDGKQYFLPLRVHPWVVIYRKSLFQAKGYKIPTTISELTALGDLMRKDGLIPLAFGNQDGWSAVGVLNIIDMRLNGHGFHTGLMAGTERWTDPKVKAVFAKWVSLLPYFDPAGLDKTWQSATQDLFDGNAGMCFQGTIALDLAADAAVRDDLDYIPFPGFGTEYDAEKAIDALIDGFMVANKAHDTDAARAWLEFIATPDAQRRFVSPGTGTVAAVKDADTAAYSPAQLRIAEIISGAGKIAQGRDRDINPAFAGDNGLRDFLQRFLQSPKQDLGAFLKGIEDFYNAAV